MKQILVYGDSLSWGIIPGSRKRLAFLDRWPGVLECELRRQGHDVRMIEDCLNGRRTVLDDPIKPGRCGLEGLEQRIEINSPLTLVMIFLGTNDFQEMHQFTPQESAEGVGALVAAIRRAPIEPGMPVPDILVVAPPPIQAAQGAIAPKFLNAETRAVGLGAAIEDMATKMNCEFFNAGEVTSTSKVDGVHLDQDQHGTLGLALADKVSGILARGNRG